MLRRRLHLSVSLVNDTNNTASQPQSTRRTSRRSSFTNDDDVIENDAAPAVIESTSPFWTARDRSDHPDIVDLRPTMRVLLQMSSETELQPLVLLMTKAMVDACGARRVVCIFERT
jgi:hypothetical protein